MTWPAIEEINTARLTLQPLTLAHATELVAVLGDPSMYLFTGGEPPTLVELWLRDHGITASIHPGHVASAIVATRLGMSPTGKVDDDAPPFAANHTRASKSAAARVSSGETLRGGIRLKKRTIWMGQTWCGGVS